MPRKATTKQRKKIDVLFQFRIALLEIKPPIWRRIQVPDCSLGQFHRYIQDAFGWDESHLHEFEVDGQRIGPSDDDGFGLDEVIDEMDVRLSDLIDGSAKKVRWIYTYDFGDDWRHEILFEGSPPVDPEVSYPQCVDGKRACPPEDCGGTWGYVDLVAAISDKKHERHEEMLEWIGEFDPEEFDPKKATRAMSGKR